LDVRLPWPAKIAAGMLTPEKWWSFEIYLYFTSCHFSEKKFSKIRKELRYFEIFFL
jgi:hypothetical protein